MIQRADGPGKSTEVRPFWRFTDRGSRVTAGAQRWREGGSLGWVCRSQRAPPALEGGLGPLASPESIHRAPRPVCCSLLRGLSVPRVSINVLQEALSPGMHMGAFRGLDLQILKHKEGGGRWGRNWEGQEEKWWSHSILSLVFRGGACVCLGHCAPWVPGEGDTPPQPGLPQSSPTPNLPHILLAAAGPFPQQVSLGAGLS